MYVYFYSKYALASAELFLLVIVGVWKWLVVGSLPDFFFFFKNPVLWDMR